MRRAGQWLDQRPWWLFAPLYCALTTLLFTAAVYVAAWKTGGARNGYVGFTRTGHLDIPWIAAQAPIFTAIVMLIRAWRRFRAPADRRPEGHSPA
jgi:hypothetical protein